MRRISHAPCKASSCQNSPAFGVFSAAPPHLTFSAAASNGGPYTCRGVRGVPELQPARGLPTVSPAIAAVDGGRGAESRPGTPAHLDTLCCVRRPQVSITKHLQQASHGSNNDRATDTLFGDKARARSPSRFLLSTFAPTQLRFCHRSGYDADQSYDLGDDYVRREPVQVPALLVCNALQCASLPIHAWRIVFACFISCRALRNV